MYNVYQDLGSALLQFHIILDMPFLYCYVIFYYRDLSSDFVTVSL